MICNHLQVVWPALDGSEHPTTSGGDPVFAPRPLPCVQSTGVSGPRRTDAGGWAFYPCQLITSALPALLVIMHAIQCIPWRESQVRTVEAAIGAVIRGYKFRMYRTSKRDALFVALLNDHRYIPQTYET
jgi:hypothetical protein